MRRTGDRSGSPGSPPSPSSACAPLGASPFAGDAGKHPKRRGFRCVGLGPGVSVLGSLPGVRAVRSYRRAWLARDVVAGVVLSTLLVPQGMAYAELAGLPPITGLYPSILCLLGYAVFGPS